MMKLTVDNYSSGSPMMEDHLIRKDHVEPIQNENMPKVKCKCVECAKLQSYSHHLEVRLSEFI